MADADNPVLPAAGAALPTPAAAPQEPSASPAPAASLAASDLGTPAVSGAAPAAGDASTTAPPAATPATEAKAPDAADPPRELTLFEKMDKEKSEREAAEKVTRDAKDAADKAKPAEPAKAADAAKPGDEAKPATDAAKPEPLAPVEYKYTLPDTIKMDDATKGIVHAAFDAFRADPALGAQKLIDLHNERMGEYAKQVRADQYTAFNKTRAEGRAKVMGDEELGGSGHQTALAAAARMRDLVISSAKPGTAKYEADMKEFNDWDRMTGGSDFAPLLRIFHNMARFLDEPQSNSILPNIKPPKGNGRGGRLSEVLHDNPRSHPTRQS
jgi:hypothetical protein